MPDVDKIDGVSWGSIDKVSGVDKSLAAKVVGLDGPADDIFWLVWADDRALWSTASLPYLAEHWHKYSMVDMTSDGFSVTYGKDHQGNDVWWGCTNGGANALHVASASSWGVGHPGPTASAHWSKKNQDDFNHPDGETVMGGNPNDIIYTTVVSPPLWIIVGDDGGYIISSSGTIGDDDWLSKKDGNAMTSDGSNFYDAQSATVSGTTLIVGGDHAMIVTAALPNNWGVDGMTNLPHGRIVHAYGNGTDCGQMLNANIGTLHYATGTNLSIVSNRIMSIGDTSNKSLDVPWYATGSFITAHGVDSTYGPSESDCFRNEWTASVCAADANGGTSFHIKGDGSSTLNGEWRDLYGDGKETWVIVGEQGKSYVSIDNGATFTQVILPDHASAGSGIADGDSDGDGDIHNVQLFAVFYFNGMWLVGGEDGYMCYSTGSSTQLTQSANWHFVPNGLYQNEDGLNDGHGVNRNIRAFAVNKMNTGNSYGN